MSQPSPSAEILLEHRAFVHAIARGLLGDDHAAEDVVQESLLAGLRQPPRGPNVRGWLGAVARNLALMSRRAESRRQRREERVARPEALPSTADAVARLEVQRRIVDAVLALEEPYRETVVRRFFHDMTPEEIAARLGVPRETVRTRLRRALEQLRQRLDAEYGGDRRSWSLILIPVVLPAARKGVAAGVVAMTTKTKICFAVLAGLLLMIPLGWEVLREEREARGGSRGTRAAPHASSTAPGESAPEFSSPIDFARIDRDRDLHGRVVSPEGEPVAGARLQVIFRPWERANTLADFAPEPGPETRSAPDGSFRLALRRGALVDLHVEAAGYAEVTLARLQAGERARITLSHARATVIRVVDVRGQPVAGARVEAARYATAGGPRIERKQATGSEGRAVFDGLPAGVTLHATASHPDFGRPLGAQELTAGDEVEIVLDEGRFFSGRVVDAETMAPVRDARIGMNWLLDPATGTDAAGRYRLNGWITGRNVYHALHVLAPGYARGVVRITNETTIDIALERGDFVEGRAVDDAGRPIANARVAVVGDQDWVLSMAHGLTDSAGRFRLGALNRTMPHALVVTAPGHGRTLAGIRPRADGPGTIELGDVTLPHGRSIEGRVVDEQGQPVARVEVVLRGGHDARGLAPPPRDLYHGSEEERLTDDLGRFRFPDLGPGAYQLRLQPRGSAAVELNVELGDRDMDGISLTVPGGRPFTVIVEDDSGRPVPNADVVASHQGGTSYMRTGPDGRAGLTVRGPIDAVEVYSVAHGPDGTTPPFRGYPKARDLAADATEVRLVLERWEQITGMVVDESGKGVGRARVVAAWEGGSRFTFTSAQGEFRAVVPPGVEAALVVQGRMTSDTSFDPDLTSKPVRAASGARDLRLTAEPAAHTRSLRVTVVDPDGRPVPGARVSCEGGTAVTNANGTVHLTALPARAVRVEARAGNFAPPVPIAALPRGQEVTLRCRAGVLLRGNVMTSARMPAAARVLVLVGEEEFEAQSGAGGRFEVMIPADAESITLIAVAGNERAFIEKHDLDAGEPVLQLQPDGKGR